MKEIKNNMSPEIVKRNNIVVNGDKNLYISLYQIKERLQKIIATTTPTYTRNFFICPSNLIRAQIYINFCTLIMTVYFKEKNLKYKIEYK